MKTEEAVLSVPSPQMDRRSQRLSSPASSPILTTVNLANTSTVNLANNDCGYNDNSRITTEFSLPEQSPIQL